MKKFIYLGNNENVKFLKKYIENNKCDFVQINLLEDYSFNNSTEEIFLIESLFEGITKIEEKFSKFINDKFSYNENFKNGDVKAINEHTIGLSILEVNDFGGINEMLKISKNQDSEFADTLHRWQRSLTTLGRKVPQAFYNKLWLEVYETLDSKEELPFDFNHRCFDKLNRLIK